MKKRYAIGAAAAVVATTLIVIVSTNGPSSHASCCADRPVTESIVDRVSETAPPTTELAAAISLERAPEPKPVTVPSVKPTRWTPTTTVVKAAADIPAATTTTTTAPTTTTVAPLPTQAPRPAGDASSFTLLNRNGARWSSCDPIHYVVDITKARNPEVALQTVKTAFERIAGVTGFNFVYDGPAHSNDNYGQWRAPYQPDAYGERWAPVLVEFTDTLGSAVRGQAQSNVYPNADGKMVVTSGQIAFNAGYGATLGVIMHEIGHVIGLGHVGDASQLMAEHSRVQEFGAGDLAGFKLQGASNECLEIPKPRN